MARLTQHGLRRVLGTSALFSTAYGNVGSSIYYALGLVASYALGLTPVVFLLTGVIFYLTAALVLAGHSRWHLPATAAAIILALLIGISRVMLGVHWPSDVIGGWAFGLLWVLLTLRPAERLLYSGTATDQTALS